MSDVLITSSLLILALLLLRRVFRGVISRRVQYALWGLVLVRLLAPVSLLDLPHTHFSVLTAARPIQAAVVERTNMHIFYSDPVRKTTPEDLAWHDIRLSNVPTADDGSAMILMEPSTISALPPQQEGYLVRDPETNTVTLYKDMAVGPWEILRTIWKGGMVLMGAWFVISNGRFYWTLRKNRTLWQGGESKRRLYLVPDGVIPSPCLFGGAIYLTPAAVESPEKLWHVLTHEETHARHWDPVWSLLRCVCLTVYWFDPLVWIAAACAKTDCELACDEGALARLGEDERIPYGKTLLSLIPVKKGPGDPLLSATTMTAGKKQLKDRITRITQNPKQLMAAVLAVAVLVTVVAACTFTGGYNPAPAESGRPAESVAPVEVFGPVALTGEELRWFNREFFNSPDPEAGYQYNIRNQFANPLNLYDAPENIDLYELFYLEGSAPSDEELGIVWKGYSGNPDDLPCPAYKLTRAEMNDILKANMGLTLADTGEPTNLTYDETTDAYYQMHGDTNYCGDLDFLYGTRETTGDATLVKLYHNSGFAGSSWYCVTLSEQEDGSYWFKSNDMCAHPAIPPVTPSGDPEAAISLKDLEPYAAETVTVENRPESDFNGRPENRLENWNFDGHHVMVYKAVDGKVRAAVEREDGSFDVFLTMDEEQYGTMFFYNDLFGKSGFYVDHMDVYKEHPDSPILDYYYFDESDVLTRLLRCTRPSLGQIDLDGDGTDELLFSNGFFFQRDGLLYQANWPTLLPEALPDPDYWGRWYQYGRFYYAEGTTNDAETGLTMWERYLYFDGENILVYRDEKPTKDHMVEGIDKGVPEEVVAQAKAYVEGLLEPQADGTWLQKGWEQYDEHNYVIDDWRIESFGQTSSDQVGDAVIEGWAFNYEFHTPEPKKVMWAGGMYVTEDGWVCPSYPGCQWMFFHNEGGKLTYLDGAMLNDMAPGSSAWQQYMEEMAQEHGLDDGKGRSAAAAQIQEDLDYFMGLETICYNYQTGEGEGHFAFGSPNDGNARNRQHWFTQPDTYRWSYALTMPDYRAGDYAKTPSLTIADSTWERYLRFWPDSDYVFSVKPGEGGTWYKVENLTDPADVFYENSQIFNFMRLIYDEAEFTALKTAALAAEPRLTQDFSDDFKLYDWSRAWAEQYELAHSQVTSGSSFAFSWQKVIECDVMDQTEDSMRVWYTLAFVPENDLAYRSSWAGNTDEFVNFPNPDPAWGVPDGALYYGRVLRMEKGGGGWYIKDAGTG